MLTECSASEINFGRAGGRRVVADFDGLLAPLIGALRGYFLAGDRLHGDDTPIPVLEPGRGRTKTGRLSCPKRSSVW